MENEFAHDLREGFSCDVREKRLQDYVAAAGIAPESAGDDVDADGLGVGGFLAVEDLHDGGNRFIGSVTGETVDREAGTVAKDAADGDFFFYGEDVVGDFPRAELEVDVFIEAEFAVLHEAKSGQRGHGFADGGGLEKRVGCYGFLGSDFGETISASPKDLAVVEEGDADAWYFVGGHAAGDGHRLRWLAFDNDSRKKAAFNSRDAS